MSSEAKPPEELKKLMMMVAKSPVRKDQSRNELLNSLAIPQLAQKDKT
nr:hypothetical protein [Heyndrickxia oleronia]